MDFSGVEPFSPLEIHPTSTSKPVSTSTPTNPHICGSCGKTFSRIDNKDRHTASFHGKTSVKCKICPKQFSFDRSEKVMESSYGDGVSGLPPESAIRVKYKRERRCCGYWWMLAVISLVISLAGILTVVFVQLSTPEHVYVVLKSLCYQYGIVFDAGSTHTSMYVYRWEGDKKNGTAEVIQLNKACKSPALSSFEKNPQQAGDSLSACLANAKTQIPSEVHLSTKVFLGATAGMRLMNASNLLAAKTIFLSVRDTISKSPFSFLDPERQARIISGEEEGTFSWITVNYFSGTLGVNPQLSAAPVPITHGALDMGGASTQITYAPERPTDLPSSYKYHLRLYGLDHTVYTHSFLCYGIMEALRRFQAKLVTDQGNSTNSTGYIQNPCGPKGHTVTVPHEDVFEAPCTKGPQAITAFGSEILPLSNLDAPANYSFVGDSDPSLCDAKTAELFNFTEQCNYPHCSFNGVFQPGLSGDFYAFSSFFYQVQFLNLTDGNSTFSLEDFQSAVTELCNSTWDQVRTMKTSFPEALPWYCFETNFVLTILTRGYGFNSSNWGALYFKKKVNNGDLGWALGFMTNSSNLIPAELPEEPLSLLTMILLLILFVLFLAIAFGFAFFSYKIYRASRDELYERLNGDGYGTM